VPISNDHGEALSRDEQGETSVRVLTHKLSKSERFWCGLLGVAVLAPAETALYFGHDGSALLGFTVIGGIGLLLAAVGRLPVRARFKDYQIDLITSDGEVIDELAAQVPPQMLSQVLRETKGTEGPVGQRLTAHVLFEAEMIALVRETAERHGAVAKVEYLDPDGVRWDLVLTRKDGKPAYVDVKLRVDEKAVRTLLGRMNALPPGTTAVLICQEASPAAKRLVNRIGNHSAVILAPESGEDVADSVRRGIDEILTK
jgi:catechol 2,3-dioxygenase-like lactoylglutathione lyase family enzyme